MTNEHDTEPTAEAVGDISTPVEDRELRPSSEVETPVEGELPTALEDPPTEEQPARTPEEISGAVEALLLMTEEPIPAATIAAAVAVPVEVVSEALQRLRDFYDETGRGFELRHLGGGWRYYTRAEHAEVISAYVLSGQQSKLSQAALETLAVIAYRQPISRARVSAVRGVNVDGVVRTLLARNVIAESGQDFETGAVLFVTTDHFLERMGLGSLDELPPLAPHLPDVADMEAELADLAGPSGEESLPSTEESGQSTDGSGPSGEESGPSGEESGASSDGGTDSETGPEERDGGSLEEQDDAPLEDPGETAIEDRENEETEDD